jgi:TatA/E family protein of Tat protein translocase
MFGPLGFPELVFILVLALLIFGPKKLPEIGRTLGKGLAEFRRATDDLKRNLNTEITLEEEKPRRPQMGLARPADKTAALHATIPAAGFAPSGATAEDAPSGPTAGDDASGSPAGGETAPAAAGATDGGETAPVAVAHDGGETPAEAPPAVTAPDAASS